MRLKSLMTGVVLCLLVASASYGQAAGIRATVTNADPMTLAVDIDVTAYMDYSYGFSTVWLGFPTGPTSSVPAVDWGDGSVVPTRGYGPSTGIPQVATSTIVGGFNVHIYRGSFSHAYAAPGAYTITTATVPSVYHPPVTGTYATAGTANGGTVTFISNTVVADLAGGGPPVIEVPTASEVGLLLLALALVGAGLVVMRRN